MTPADVGVLVDLYDGPVARRRYSEEVTQLDHALQTAALASEAGASDELVVAALLHDVGHFVADEQAHVGTDAHDDLRHEEVGGRYLRRWFGAAVTGPVVLHVAAKRYLCAVEPGYRDELSAASAHSLELQGGTMTAAECARFESLPQWSEAVRLRRWDDEAKVVGATTPGFATYVPLLRRSAGAA